MIALLQLHAHVAAAIDFTFEIIRLLSLTCRRRSDEKSVGMIGCIAWDKSRVVAMLDGNATVVLQHGR